MTDTLKTCLLTGRMALPDGGPVREASVDFALTRPDWEGAIMPPERVSVPLDAGGGFTTPLWPNVRGAQGSRYKVQMRYRPGAYVAVIAVPLGEITVPDVPAADLADLLDLPPSQPIGESILRQVLDARNAATEAARQTSEDRIAVGSDRGAAESAARQTDEDRTAVNRDRDAVESAASQTNKDMLAAQSASDAAALSASAAAGSAGAASADAARAEAARAEIAAGVATEYGCHIYNAVSLPSGVYIASRHVRAAGVLDNYYVELISGNGLYLVTVEVNGVGKTSWEVSPGAPIKQGAASIPVNVGDNISLVVSGAPNPGEMIVKLWGVLS